jgi:hypothetical protein
LQTCTGPHVRGEAFALIEQGLNDCEDGCHFINRTDIHRPKPHEYLSYDFSNMSKDIVDLFVEACARVRSSY